MTGEETARIESLVIAYENTHAERIGGKEGEPRKLLASRPILAEYRAVSEAVRAAAPRPRHSDAFVEGYVDDLL